MATVEQRQSSTEDLEALVRRLVREELATLLKTSSHRLTAIGSSDKTPNSTDDDLALIEALNVLREHSQNPAAWMDWSDFEAELTRAEAAGELPD